MGDSSIVVGVFKEEVQAESAVDVLRDVGFNSDQIGYAGHTGKWGTDHILDYLVSMGVPEEEVSYYESEYEAGRSIVLVKHDGRRSEALNILFLNGSRVHRYLNLGKHVSEDSSDVTDSTNQGLNIQIEASQNSPANNSSKSSSARKTEPEVQDEMASLRKLLKDVDLDHLL
jgi:hypothetical protein